MSRKDRSASRRAAVTSNTSVCYCDGTRVLGTMELYCSGCNKWFHGKCLKDLAEFYGVNFMVCYVFQCSNCSSTKKESWVPKQANFVHMCVTVLANLTTEYMKKESMSLEEKLSEHIYFNLERSIIPYFKTNWSLLTSMPVRVKNTWHSTLHKTLLKETELFKVDPSDETSFALAELDLSLIGPSYEPVKQIGKKTSAGSNLTSTLVDQSKIEKLTSEEGPKTRGASKRKNVDNCTIVPTGKKQKTTADYSTTRVGSSAPIDIPFNKEGYRYHVIEKDNHIPHKNSTDDDDSAAARMIPGYTYRLVIQPNVTISPNDRAYQLRLSEDHLSVSGHEGYCIARATHSVVAGKWYFEVNVTRCPPEAAIRIGWAQQYAVVQACVGYNKFSYGWRSHKGTKFHAAVGKTYYPPGYGEGDVLGCLIDLPFDYDNPGSDSSKYLPNSGKDHALIKFKNNYFYEEHDESSVVAKTLQPLNKSSIEFFRNGKSCGVAFTDIYSGFYFPAVSIFHQATVRLNFGPNFAHPPPKGVRGMSERVKEVAVQQTVSDMLYIVDKGLIDC